MGSAATASPPPPPSGNLTQDELKRVAAHRAVEFVEPGMTLGLGTGSTAGHALDRLGDLLRAGALPGVAGVPTSLKTEAHAARVGIPLLPLEDAASASGAGGIRLSIDGADEVDPDLNLVKGRGGSLLREKMVEGAGDRFVVIVDESKLVPRLGCTGAVPIEVIPFGAPHTLGLIRKVFDGVLGFHARLRTVPAPRGWLGRAVPHRQRQLHRGDVLRGRIPYGSDIPFEFECETHLRFTFVCVMTLGVNCWSIDLEGQNAEHSTICSWALMQRWLKHLSGFWQLWNCEVLMWYFFCPQSRCGPCARTILPVYFSARGELAKCQQKLAQILSHITKIAEEFNVADPRLFID
ncbi:unnamed protein product [Miscanthus lutarioriparius]|uniref:ribose-5-phosphate isomerase n=1 Tax=Miscanthus lutarioriparius TaxID=422564 RepID=A0A811RBN0_9POAL|nr:unnamed protein product [Miscanthus lutarioriparius]